LASEQWSLTPDKKTVLFNSIVAILTAAHMRVGLDKGQPQPVTITQGITNQHEWSPVATSDGKRWSISAPVLYGPANVLE